MQCRTHYTDSAKESASRSRARSKINMHCEDRCILMTYFSNADMYKPKLLKLSTSQVSWTSTTAFRCLLGAFARIAEWGTIACSASKIPLVLYIL